MNKEQENFAERNQGFLSIYNNLCDTIDKVFVRTFYAPTPEQNKRWLQFNSSDPEYIEIENNVLTARTIFFLGSMTIDDFHEIFTLSNNGYGYGALKLLRGFYEKTVTAFYISENPNQAKDYGEYGFIQAYKIMKRAKEIIPDLDSHYSVEYLTDLAEGYQRAKAKLKETICNKCGAPKVQLSWSRLDLATMADKCGEIFNKLYLDCYLKPTAHSHATALSLMEKVSETSNGGIVLNHEPNRKIADSSLKFAHQLMLLNLSLNNDYFDLKLDEEIKMRIDEYSAAWHK